METDPKYSMLWELFQSIASKRFFLRVGASATFSESMVAALDRLNTSWVRCEERPYSLECNIVTVVTVKLLYEAMAVMTAAILSRGESCLLFLPGKAEITAMQQALTEKKGIRAQWISLLHADLEKHQIEKALTAVSHPKVILATSLAQTSITIPHIDHVLDSGFCRTNEAHDEIISTEDFRSSESDDAQREGRVGRVKPGSATKFVISDPSLTRARPPVSSEAIERVVASEKYHCHIMVGDMAMCSISQEQSEAARQRIKTLPLTDDELWQAVSSLPFSLREAAVFFKSMQQNVSFEVVAVLIFKNTCTWPPKHRFRLSEIVEAVPRIVDQSDPCAKGSAGYPKQEGSSQHCVHL